MKNKTIFFRLSETFDRFEIESQLEDKMLGRLIHSDEVEMERAHTSNELSHGATEKSQQNIPALGEQYHTE